MLTVRREEDVARSDETGESRHEAFGKSDLYARFGAIARNGEALVRAEARELLTISSKL